MTQNLARLTDEPLACRVRGVIALFMKKEHPSVSIGTQTRFKLPGVGIVRVDIDKHVEQALKKQSHDITKFTGSARRKDGDNQ